MKNFMVNFKSKKEEIFISGLQNSIKVYDIKVNIKQLVSKYESITSATIVNVILIQNLKSKLQETEFHYHKLRI